MIEIQVSQNWRNRYPGAAVGFLALKTIANPEPTQALEARKAAVAAELRARFAGQDRSALEALPVIQAYQAYYKAFKKNYHVLFQLESVALKDKPLPGGAALVQAMFLAELRNGLLTAGHDLDLLRAPVRVDAAHGDERYTLLRGQEQTLKAGDMFIADEVGVLSSILYGPDARTPLTPATRAALFTVYAPQGIRAAAVQSHLEEIRENVRLFAPEAETELLRVIRAEEV